MLAPLMSRKRFAGYLTVRVPPQPRPCPFGLVVEKSKHALELHIVETAHSFFLIVQRFMAVLLLGDEHLQVARQGGHGVGKKGAQKWRALLSFPPLRAHNEEVI